MEAIWDEASLNGSIVNRIASRLIVQALYNLIFYLRYELQMKGRLNDISNEVVPDVYIRCVFLQQDFTTFSLFDSKITCNLTISSIIVRNLGSITVFPRKGAPSNGHPCFLE